MMPLMKNGPKTLTIREAYLAMYAFLNIHYERFPPETEGQIAIVMGELSLLDDGKPVDPAAWSDWEKSVQKALTNDVDPLLGPLVQSS